MKEKLEKFSASGSAFITQAEFSKFMGVSRGTAKKLLSGLEAVEGKYYFIPDVATALWQKLS